MCARVCACPSLPWLVGFHYTDRLRVKVLTEKCFTPSKLMPHHRATAPYSHPSAIVDAFCIKVMVSTLTHSFKSSPERYQLMCFEVTIRTSKHTQTHTHPLTVWMQLNTADFRAGRAPSLLVPIKLGMRLQGFLCHRRETLHE